MGEAEKNANAQCDISSWILVGVNFMNAYSSFGHQFLHTTRLLRYQISQENVKKATTFFKGHCKDHSSISLKKNLAYVDCFAD